MSEQLQRGQKVGEYVVEDFLGAGAFGSVYRGVQPIIRKLVAIKVLHRQDPETTSRFINEARAVNAIRHPNLVDIFAFGQIDNGQHYLVMEWLEGEPLDAYLARVGGHVPPEAILKIVRPLARAIDAAHNAGVIHRDLKPSNAFLTLDGDGGLVPKLLDFGIAKLVDDEGSGQQLTGTGRAIGTPEYMSPEQCQGPNIDHRTDIYAFGALIFRMLTGAPVFQANTAVEIMMKQMKEEPRRPSVVLPSLPRGLDAPVLAMLAKDKAQRPNTLQEALAGFKDALEECELETDQAPPRVVPTEWAEVSVPLTEPSISQLDNEPPPNRTALFAGLAAMVVGLAALPFLLDLGGDPATPPPPPVEVAKAPPAPPPVEKKIVTVSFEGLPEGTMVLSPSGTVLATTPAQLSLPKSDEKLALRFEKSGFLPASVDIVPNASSTVSIELKRPRRRRPPRTKKIPDKDSVEDPY